MFVYHKNYRYICNTNNTSMKVYTSYYGNVKALNKAGIVPVGISIGIPKWYSGANLQQLAPTWKMVREYSRERYIAAYFQILERIGVDEIRHSFERMSEWNNGKDIALLCYEKPGDFCHRHLLAEWWAEKTGEGIEEFGEKEDKSVNQPKQLSMF